ncbi:MAG: acpS, partial [Nocardioidaceae bacterium]|nr:acpS [Nocardioidaceae bacterium]
MPTLGIGVDVVDLARFEASLERTPSLRDKLFTPAEAVLPLASLAARFAAKEALAKALGAPGNLAWHDAEVVSLATGQPVLELRGTVLARADELGVVTSHVSL